MSIDIHMPKTSFTRPGVDAAVSLYKTSDQNSSVWECILNEYEFCLKEKGTTILLDLDRKCNAIAEKWHNMENPYCTFDDLTTIIEWKFKKGKPRPLWKLIKSNSNDAVEKASAIAFKKIDTSGGDIQAAINELAILRGVGVATASAILSLYRPDRLVFMDDEVIECLYDGKREYTMKIYHDINNKCLQLSETLGDGWTPRKIGQALWTAARLSASKLKKSDLVNLMTTSTEIFDVQKTDDNKTPQKKQRRN